MKFSDPKSDLFLKKSEIRKKCILYPGKPQFYYIKVVCKGVFVTRTCFRDVSLHRMWQYLGGGILHWLSSFCLLVSQKVTYQSKVCFSEDMMSCHSTGSATVNGMRATISLLRDAKRLPSSDKNMLKFQKFGSYDQTVTDFFSVRPRDVKEFYTQSVSIF